MDNLNPIKVDARTVMAWAAVILLAVAQGCWAENRYQTPVNWGLYGGQNGLAQYGSLYGAMRFPWFSFGGSCGPCSLQPPPPCQCLQPQPSSEGTGLNSMELDPVTTTTTTTTTTTPPPPPEKRQPSMPEYIPPPPQPPCPPPVQGCTCLPGLLSMACLPVCLQGMLRAQYGQPAPQYNSQLAFPGRTGPNTGYPPLSASLPSKVPNQQFITSPNLNYPMPYTGPTLNQQRPFGTYSQNVNQPVLYSNPTLNQQFPGSYDQNQPALRSSESLDQQYPGSYGQSGYQPSLISAPLNQPYGYPDQRLNKPPLYSSFGMNTAQGSSSYSDGQNSNLPMYGSPKQNQPTFMDPPLSQSHGRALDTRRSLAQNYPGPSSKKI